MNRYSRKRRTIFAIVYVVIVVLLMVVVAVFQYKRINYNYNIRINAICSEIAEKYPDADITEIVRILNNDNRDLEYSRNYLIQYGIDIETDSVVTQNKKEFSLFLFVDVAIGVFLIAVLFIVMDRVFQNWDKKLEEITDDLVRINTGDYSYDMNTGEEGKLSILESEIYKTAIKCRESAENSRKDKEKLKESLSDISHQLKTPITSLMINLDNLEEYPDLPEEKRLMLIANAKRETNKVNQMVQMLLKLSRLDADAIEFVKKDVAVDSIIYKSIENILALCDLKGIDVSYGGISVTEDNIHKLTEKENTETLNCDPYWEIEAISNILKNGVEHAKSKVSIEFAGYEMYSEIRIANDGEQISTEEAGKIFTRYYRGETSVIDSVGIGLSLADSIVRRDGGYIMAEAYERETGETGTVFTIRYMK